MCTLYLCAATEEIVCSHAESMCLVIFIRSVAEISAKIGFEAIATKSYYEAHKTFSHSHI